MITAFTAHTREIDDTELAVSEILSQLDLTALGKHTVGILTCYSEFIDTGVVQALCDTLPFDVVGCTTLGCATGDRLGHLDLTLMVLTSDDVEFSAAVSAPLAETQEAPLRDLYRAATQRMAAAPAMILAFMPLLYNVGGEVFLRVLDDTAGLPVFGTLAVDHTKDYHEARTIYNGTAYSDALSMVVLGGAVTPKFFVAALSDERISKQKAIITDSEANILKAVNEMPAVEYLKSLGLTRDGKIEGPSTIPFIVDFGDGAKPVVRAIFAQTPEGYAVCGASMPVNSTLSIGSLDYNDVMESSRKLAREILSIGEPSALLLFSCVGRNYALAARTTDEMSALADALGAVPYQLAYSGGEVCPLVGGDGRLVNRFHNDTIVVCAL